MNPSEAFHVCCIPCGITANYLTCLRDHSTPPLKASFTVSSIYKIDCPVCGKKGVDGTEARDFFYPDFSLIEYVTKKLHKSKAAGYKVKK